MLRCTSLQALPYWWHEQCVYVRGWHFANDTVAIELCDLSWNYFSEFLPWQLTQWQWWLQRLRQCGAFFTDVSRWHVSLLSVGISGFQNRLITTGMIEDLWLWLGLPAKYPSRAWGSILTMLCTKSVGSHYGTCNSHLCHVKLHSFSLRWCNRGYSDLPSCHTSISFSFHHNGQMVVNRVRHSFLGKMFRPRGVCLPEGQTRDMIYGHFPLSAVSWWSYACCNAMHIFAQFLWCNLIKPFFVIRQACSNSCSGS